MSYNVVKEDGVFKIRIRAKDPKTKKYTNLRLNKQYYPNKQYFNSESEAREWVANKNSIERATKETQKLKANAEKIKFPEIEKLAISYLKFLTEKKVRSVVTISHWLHQYVLLYFCGQTPNIREWPLHHKKFREYLKEVKSERFNRKLAIESQNKCIIVLNGFYNYLENEHEYDTFPKIKTTVSSNEKGAEAFVEESTYKKILQLLSEKYGEDYANFYKLLYLTGMRLNEALSINCNSYIPEDISIETMDASIKKYIGPYFGYIYLKDQIQDIEDDGEIVRGVLKNVTANKANGKNAGEAFRLIPIIDADLADNLIERTNTAVDELTSRESLLFNDLTKGKFTHALRTCYNLIDVEYQSPHCLRHTRATLWMKETFNPFLLEKILGHKAKAQERYIHLAGVLKIEASRGKGKIVKRFTKAS